MLFNFTRRHAARIEGDDLLGKVPDGRFPFLDYLRVKTPVHTGFERLISHGALSHEPEVKFFTTYRVMELIEGRSAADTVQDIIKSGPAGYFKLAQVLGQTVTLCLHLAVIHSIKASDLVLNNFMIGRTCSCPQNGTLFLPDLGKCELSEKPDEACVARELAKYWQPVIDQARIIWQDDPCTDGLQRRIDQLKLGFLRELSGETPAF